eukprot:6639_1
MTKRSEQAPLKKWCTNEHRNGLILPTEEPSITWLPLAFPHSMNCCIPTGIDKDNYIIIDVGSESNNKIKGFYQYDIANNKWTKMDIPTHDFECIEYVYHSVLDRNKRILYIFGKGGFKLQYSMTISQLHLNNNKCYNDKITLSIIDETKMGIMLNNSLIMLTGKFWDGILQYNTENKTFTKIYGRLYENESTKDFGVIYNKKSNSLLLFGGYVCSDRTFSDSILCINLKTKKLNKLPVSLPQKIANVHCTMAIRNRYVLIFGGITSKFPDVYSDNIYIYCMGSKTLRISSVKCPSKSMFKAITVNNEGKDEKTVFGYMRKQWNVCDIEDHSFPPFYLLKLIHSYYLNEIVYLLDISNNKHYKMSTLD